MKIVDISQQCTVFTLENVDISIYVYIYMHSFSSCRVFGDDLISKMDQQAPGSKLNTTILYFMISCSSFNFKLYSLCVHCSLFVHKTLEIIFLNILNGKLVMVFCSVFISFNASCTFANTYNNNFIDFEYKTHVKLYVLAAFTWRRAIGV